MTSVILVRELKTKQASPSNHRVYALHLDSVPALCHGTAPYMLRNKHQVVFECVNHLSSGVGLWLVKWLANVLRPAEDGRQTMEGAQPSIHDHLHNIYDVDDYVSLYRGEGVRCMVESQKQSE